MKRFRLAAGLLAACMAWPQTSNLVAVISKSASRTIELPGEILPFLKVEIHARVQGYLDQVLVDRGSVVKRGQLMARLNAPEMTAQVAEAESKYQSAEADRLQAEAQLTAAQSTADRLKKASATPGAIAGNELIQAQAQVHAAEALVHSKQQASIAAAAAVRAQKDLESYLRVTAPFDGVITDRLVHPGDLAGPSADQVLFVLQQLSHLRLVVALPEEDVANVARGTPVEFHVPAFPSRTYSGSVARMSHSLDDKTRTMAVELDVLNRDGSLSPGMYPSVKWPVHSSQASLFVPKTSVVTTTERTFVILDQGGHAEWINVRKGSADGDLVEVSGNIELGDMVVRRASDEIRPGTKLR